MNVDQEIKKFHHLLKIEGDSSKVADEKRYLRSTYKFYGVSSKYRDGLVRDFYKNNKDLSKKNLWRLADKMWQSDYHELRAMAINLLREYDQLLDYSDIKKIEKLLRTSINWDQVDEISAHLVGNILLKDRRVYADLKRWSSDKNFWIRRAALLGQLIPFRRNKGDRKLFYRLAEKMIDESWQDFTSWAGNHPESMGRFFIRKAIGWILREISEKHPEEVLKFLLKNKDKMAGLSFREGSRKLTEKYRERIK